MVNTLCKKSTQAINYFANKRDGRINKMKAIKLIWLADRYHLRKYGRPVIGDTYWAMKFGPVASEALRIADQDSRLSVGCLKYISKYLKINGNDEKVRNLVSRHDVDLGVFSQTDIEALETVFNEYGDRDQFELADISHSFPEWSKHEDEIASGEKRVLMSYSDFFSHSKSSNVGIFNLDIEHLKDTKELYKDSVEVAQSVS